MIDFSGFREVLSFAIPEDAGSRTLIGADIARLVADEPEVLLFIFNWWGDDYSDYFDWNLFRRFRQALGDSAEVYDKPSHVLGPEDQVDLVSMVRLFLYSNWDFYLVSALGRMVFKIVSHDNLAFLYANDDRELDQKRLKLLPYGEVNRRV